MTVLTNLQLLQERGTVQQQHQGKNTFLSQWPSPSKGSEKPGAGSYGSPSVRVGQEAFSICGPGTTGTCAEPGNPKLKLGQGFLVLVMGVPLLCDNKALQSSHGDQVQTINLTDSTDKPMQTALKLLSTLVIGVFQALTRISSVQELKQLKLIPGLIELISSHNSTQTYEGDFSVLYLQSSPRKALFSLTVPACVPFSLFW